MPQQGQKFVCVHTTHVDLDAAVTKSLTITKAALLLDDLPIIKSEDRRSLDSLMKPITAVDVITPDPIPRRNRFVLSGGVISARTKSGSASLGRSLRGG